MKRSVRIMVNILLIFLLQSCHHQENKTWNQGNTCALPCWNGAVVGSTTKSELMQVLKELPVIDQEKTLMDGESWQFFSGRSFFKFRDVEIHGVAYYLGDKLVRLAFSGNLRTSFGDMVDLLGEPKYIINVLTPLPTVGYSVTAIYPTLGIEYTYNTSSLSKRMSSEISPEIPIDYISIFNPEIYEDMINASLFGQGFLSGEETKEYMRPWVGYGPLKEMYPPATIR